MFDLAAWAAISHPTLVVDKSRAVDNIRRMMRKAADSGVRFRPHFKTHASLAIGRWFRELGVSAITVSSVEMARLFADDGWRDITIAFPVNMRARSEIERLAREVNLGLLVDSHDAASAVSTLEASVTVWIDVDVGYGRTGISWNDRQTLGRVLRLLSKSPRHRVQGLLTHAGHAYAARSVAAIREVHRESVERMNAARAAIAKLADSGFEISVGDTPTCSLARRFDGIDEIRPGNFVFYDLQQLVLGTCSTTQLALMVACPVVGAYPARREIVMQGGSVHLSRDHVEGVDGNPVYGRLAVLNGDSWELGPSACQVTSLSQEHGVLKVTRATLDHLRPGDLALIVPAHACLAANLIREYVTTDGSPVR